jgi:catechol 2,3-dioxygenase-like lactoylglutathione lyase family enzyme
MMQVDFGSAVFVRNLDAALAFYKKLGFELKERGSRQGVSWVEVALANDEVWIALIEFQEATQFKNRIGGHTGLVFVSRNLHDAHKRLKDKHVRFEWEPKPRPWGCSDAQFMDQDGNKILLVEEGDSELKVLRSHRPTD